MRLTHNHGIRSAAISMIIEALHGDNVHHGAGYVKRFAHKSASCCADQGMDNGLVIKHRASSIYSQKFTIGNIVS